VISKLLERDRQLGQVSSRYWREIDRDNPDFNSREQLARAVRNVTLDDLRQTFRAAVNERQRALLVVTGQDIKQENSVLEQLRQRPPVSRH